MIELKQLQKRRMISLFGALKMAIKTNGIKNPILGSFIKGNRE